MQVLVVYTWTGLAGHGDGNADFQVDGPIRPLKLSELREIEADIRLHNRFSSLVTHNVIYLADEEE